MASAMASDTRVDFSAMIADFGQTTTVACRKSTITYTGNMRVSDTTTNWTATAITYTAIVQAVRPMGMNMARLADLGIQERDAIIVYFRYNAVVAEDAKIMYQGRVYYVKFAPEDHEAYRQVLAASTGGQRGDA